jgi:hypothetical protein
MGLLTNIVFILGNSGILADFILSISLGFIAFAMSVKCCGDCGIWGKVLKYTFAFITVILATNVFVILESPLSSYSSLTDMIIIASGIFLIAGTAFHKFIASLNCSIIQYKEPTNE